MSSSYEWLVSQQSFATEHRFGVIPLNCTKTMVMKPDKRFCFISSAGVFGLNFAQISVELMSMVIMSETGKLGDFQENFSHNVVRNIALCAGIFNQKLLFRVLSAFY